MLDEQGFDSWVREYDDYVKEKEENNEYPFAGYSAVLADIFERIQQHPHSSVLDLGFGTAVLTARLYEAGHTVYGQDASEGMLEYAKQKMPGAVLLKGDFKDGLCRELREQKYDFITATYSLHHLNDGEKILFLKELLEYLNPEGEILIGDIAFPTREKLEACRAEAGGEWDEEECYFVAEELRLRFPQLTFLPLSFCGGVLTVKKTAEKDPE